MFGIIKKVDGHIQAVGNRWQAYLAYAAFWTGVVSAAAFLLHWARPFFPAGLGWAEATVLAIAALCALTVVVSIALVAWRYFNPLIPKLSDVVVPSGTEKPKSYLNTDIHLEDMLRSEIHGLDGRFFKQLGDVNASLTALIQSFAADLNEKMNANNAVFRTEMDTIAQQYKALNLDVLQLLNFAVDLATVEYLDNLLREGPKITEPIATHESADVRKAMYDFAAHYIQMVTAQLGDTHRGQVFRSNMAFAIQEAERELPASGWPEHIKFVDYRRYAITELQLVRATAFLEFQKREVIAKIGQARGNLIGRMNDREKAMKSS